MKNKSLKIAVVVLVLINIAMAFTLHLAYTKRKVEPRTDTLYITRDMLIEKIDTIRDSIIRIDEKFRADYDVIISQPVDSDYLFFTRYLQGQYGDDNGEATKAN